VLAQPTPLQVTCGIATPMLGKVLASMDASIAAAGIEANIITSGFGDWKFMVRVSDMA